MKVLKYLLVTFVALAAIATFGNLIPDPAEASSDAPARTIRIATTTTASFDDFEIDADMILDMMGDAAIDDACTAWDDAVDAFGYDTAETLGYAAFAEGYGSNSTGVSAREAFNALVARC